MKTTEEIMNAYAEKIDELETQLLQAQDQITLLQGQLEAAKRTGAAGSSDILTDGEEKDLYVNERHEILLDVLKEASKNIKPGSRRADVINDLIAHNPVTGEPRKRIKAIKEILKGYRGMNEKIKSKLRSLGIHAKDQHKKHYMLHYYDDSRYFVTMTATGSDAGRGGQNLASDIAKKFF